MTDAMVAAPALASAPLWPPPLVDVDFAVDVLREAIATKSGSSAAFQFLRTLAPFDRELLDDPPSEIVLPAALGREVVARRYGLFLLLQKPAGPVQVDEQALRAVEKEVGRTLDAVQKVVQQHMAARDNAATREASATHSAISRALGDVRTLAKRLQGSSAAAVPLDGDGHRVATFDMQSAKPVEPPKAAAPKFDKRDLERGSPWPLRIGGLVLIAALAGFLAWRNLPKPAVEQWDAKRLAAMPKVTRVLVREGHAVVTVAPGWTADQPALAALQKRLRDANVEQVVVVNEGGRALAQGATAAGLVPVEKKTRAR